jgi:hypothetical protein
VHDVGSPQPCVVPEFPFPESFIQMNEPKRLTWPKGRVEKATPTEMTSIIRSVSN